MSVPVHYGDTIAAIATSLGEGGIGIVRLSGPKALSITDSIAVLKEGMLPSQSRTYSLHYGWIVDALREIAAHSRYQASSGEKPPSLQIVDEVLIAVMRSPKSYTKEDIAEIHCHGGIIAVRRILELVCRHGARLAEPGEFTKRAFLNGRIDLIQAEAVADIVKAKTDASLKMAVSQLEGTLSSAITALLDELISILSSVEAALDFPEEDIEIIKEDQLQQRLQRVIAAMIRLIATADQGIVMREGLLAIICGKANVGKSSLMNLLLKRDRVIVAPLPGTTRDAIEENINVRGIPLRIMDTAGIGGRTGDAMERAATHKAKHYLDMADIAIFVLDGSQPLGAEDEAVMRFLRKRKKLTVTVINKNDLVQRLDDRDITSYLQTEAIVHISAKEGNGIDNVQTEIAHCVLGGKLPHRASPIVTNMRHKESLEKALRYARKAFDSLRRKKGSELVSVDIREAIYHAGLIIGRSASDDVLNGIFENFCIGK